MFNSDWIRGYSDEQYTRANIFLLVDYLARDNIIDLNDFYKFYYDNINEFMKQLVESDRKNRAERMKDYQEKHKKEVE